MSPTILLCRLLCRLRSPRLVVAVERIPAPSRRSFLAALGMGTLALPGRALAQPTSKVARVGLLYYSTRQSFVDTGRDQAFVQGMRELGYIEGKHFTVEARFADGKTERLPALAGELVHLKVDVILATGAAVVRAVHHATTTIPIVAAILYDPVGDGFVPSLARPGGNITGLAFTAANLGPKQLELLKALTPRLSRVAVLLHPGNPAHPQQLVGIMSAAQEIGIQVVLAQAGTAADVERACAMTSRERAPAMIVLADPFFLGEPQLIAAQAMKHRLALISGLHELTEAGGLMSYGPNLLENYRRAATYVDRILKGAKPGDLPFEQPTRYQLVINGKTAKALGLTIPPSLRGQADEVIE